MPGLYGTDYFYPTSTELDYFKSKGLMLVRFPFRWERIQHELNGPLDATELNRMKTFISAAQNKGMHVLLDMHNYGRRRMGDKNVVIGSNELSVASVADVWAKLANEFKSYTNIWGYALMNEPYDMLESTPWATIAQSIINEIRKIDTKTNIIVGGDSWSSAVRWRQVSDNLKNLNDPSNKIIYEAHLYFDRDASGTYGGSYEVEGGTPMRGVERAYHFIGWLKENDKKGFIGEYGIPADDTRWLTTLDNLLKDMVENNVNGTYWAAGPNWDDYKLSAEPNAGADKPQLAVLTKYKNYDPANTSTATIISRDAGVTATASGFSNETETPDKARDGNYITKWSDNVSSRDKWLQLDFGKNVNISRIMLEWEGWDVTKKYKIQTSADANNWADVITETNSNEPLRVFNVNLANVKYIRLHINAADDDVVRLMELDVWGR